MVESVEVSACACILCLYELVKSKLAKMAEISAINYIYIYMFDGVVASFGLEYFDSN